MNREPFFRRKTSLSYKTEEQTVLRGYNLSDIAEKGYSFSDALFVLFQDRIPTENEAKMLTYEMGVFIEHSMSPLCRLCYWSGYGSAESAGNRCRFRYDVRWGSWPGCCTWIHDEQIS